MNKNVGSEGVITWQAGKFNHGIISKLEICIADVARLNIAFPKGYTKDKVNS